MCPTRQSLGEGWEYAQEVYQIYKLIRKLKITSDGESMKFNMNYAWWRGLLFGLSAIFAVGQILADGGQIISTAPGGTSTQGYQGSLVSTSTILLRGTIICKQGIDVSGTLPLFYDADGPVYGAIKFNGNSGSLKLASDLRLGSTCALRTAVADSYMIINAGESANASVGGQTIIMGDDLRLTFSTKFISNCVIDGRGNTLTLQAPLSVFNNSTSVTLKNMRLLVCPGTGTSTGNAFVEPFIFNANNQSQSINLCNVDLCLPIGKTTHVVTAGRLNLNNQVNITGSGGIFKMFYAGAGTASPKIIIGNSSKFLVGQGVTLSLWGSPDVPQGNRLVLNGVTSQLWLDGCTLDISAATAGTTQGLMLKQGTLFFDNKVTVSSTIASMVVSDITNGLQLGDGTAANDIDVRVRGGAYLDTIGSMCYNHS